MRKPPYITIPAKQLGGVTHPRTVETSLPVSQIMYWSQTEKKLFPRFPTVSRGASHPVRSEILRHCIRL